MSVTGVGITLPHYISTSAVFPAFIFDKPGCIVAANTLCKSICGINIDDECKRLHEVFTCNSFAGVLNTLQTATITVPVAVACLIQGYSIQWEVAPFSDGYFIATGVITSREEIGMFSSNSFSTFFENSPALKWATDKSGRIQMMNKSYMEHTGFTSAQVGALLWDIYPREMADQFKKNDDIVLQTNKLLKIEEVSVDKAGVKRQYLAYKFPLHTDKYGTMVAGCSIDITDVADKTKQLSFQNSLLDSIEQAVYILDPQTNVIYWSKYAEEMFGWTKEEIRQKPVSILIPSGTLSEDMLEKLLNKQSWHGEIELKRRDGGLIQVHSTKSPVLDDNNNITAIIGICKDITERKTVHKKLVKQNNQFRQIARLQSHAVRRPLANMLGLIDLVQYYADKKDFDEILYLINLLKQSSEDLDDIIRRIVLKAGIYFDPELRIA